jgi:hypothetical protein
MFTYAFRVAFVTHRLVVISIQLNIIIIIQSGVRDRPYDNGVNDRSYVSGVREGLYESGVKDPSYQYQNGVRDRPYLSGRSENLGSEIDQMTDQGKSKY